MLAGRKMITSKRGGKTFQQCDYQSQPPVYLKSLHMPHGSSHDDGHQPDQPCKTLRLLECNSANQNPPVLNSLTIKTPYVQGTASYFPWHRAMVSSHFPLYPPNHHWSIRNRLLDTLGEGEGGMIFGNSAETYR